MADQLHIVCPHCDAINRLATERLTDHPVCGQCKQPLFTGHPLELAAANFDRHIGRSDLPVVVDFWAPWCGPCRAMAPAFAQAAAQLEPRARLVKVNTESEPALAERFAIRSIPTLAIFRQGREIARQAGAVDVSTLLRWIKPHI
ncbi:MAG: thioredoxin TrxC [Betaproteobacteria bacterium]